MDLRGLDQEAAILSPPGHHNIPGRRDDNTRRATASPGGWVRNLNTLC